MKFKDCNGSSIISMGKADRAKLLTHLQNASATVSDQKHAVHSHLLKAAAVIGAIKDRSEDDGAMSTDFDQNLTSPGVESRNLNAGRLGAEQPVGGSDVAARAAGDSQDLFKSLLRGERATFEIRRAAAVTALYKMAAKATSSAEKARLEKTAYQLDKIDGRDVEKAAANRTKNNVVGAHRPARSFQERHGF
jgi:hypothetical protein